MNKQRNKQTIGVDDAYFMLQAIKEAYKARKAKEIPIGAVIIKDKEIIAKGFNKCISLFDPTAHAENIALRKAAKKFKNYRLNNCSIYVTIEPCMMCIGALINARIKRIIFGACDKKIGACESIYKVTMHKKLNHKIEIKGGEERYLSTKCADIIKNFFKEKRAENKKVILI
ncbi:MAG: tRNA adenosine(34) deaminase TadA [Endomicrobium sp.]|jgi:tRNA(adenine34) deaminase|nr:tRNA adenosine(34) deaminase TadA [Endomicrobium sp.]